MNLVKAASGLARTTTVTVAVLVAGPAAAVVQWGPAVDSTGQASDVITTGALLAAITFSPTVTVNGVTFENVSLGEPNQSNFGVLTGFGQFDSGWDADYRTLVNTTAYAVLPTQLEFIFGVLPRGNYLVQLFMPQWDANWATAFSINGLMSPVVEAGGFIPGLGFGPRERPQWISARIRADGQTSYSVVTEGVTTYQVISALQLRTAVPEPDSWALLIAGFGLTGAVLRRRRSALPA
jgi:hypothetical protein